MWHRKHRRKSQKTGPEREAEAKPATEEDLQPRDAREMPRGPQDPVNPGGEAAT